MREDQSINKEVMAALIEAFQDRMCKLLTTRSAISSILSISEFLELADSIKSCYDVCQSYQIKPNSKLTGNLQVKHLI